MATSVTCPTCGRSYDASPGGPMACPHCHPGRPRVGASGRPALLDELPVSFLASPAMYAIAGAVAFLYGIVLFGVVSSHRRQAELAAKEAEEHPPVAAHVALPLDTAPATPSPAAKPEAAASKSAPEPPPKPEATAPKSEPPKPDVPRPDAPKKKKESNKTSVAVAAKAATPEPAAPTPAPRPTGATWGMLSGDPGDCDVVADGEGATIHIPGKLHALSPELNTMNAPRLLTEVRGDFTAQVRVLGRILPGTDPLPKLPFTFQGAGLLVWADEKNYLRLERSSAYSAVERKKYNQVLVELCRDGKTNLSTRDVKDADVDLKMERKGSEIRCWYSPDAGKTWLDVKRQNVGFDAAVQVGVSASSASPKGFDAKLSDFALNGKGR